MTWQFKSEIGGDGHRHSAERIITTHSEMGRATNRDLGATRASVATSIDMSEMIHTATTVTSAVEMLGSIPRIGGDWSCTHTYDVAAR